MRKEMLLSHNFIEIQKLNAEVPADKNILTTVLCNFIYYGYVLSIEAMKVLETYSEKDLVSFWNNTKPALEKVTGASANMGDFVVYKNFPKEVLNKTESEYWTAQIFIYFGFHTDYFTEEVKERPSLKDKKDLKVLALADENTETSILNSLITMKNRWNDNQELHANYLADGFNETSVVKLSDFGFKENGISFINTVMNKGVAFEINDATDVLRLAAAMSDADVSLRIKPRFKKFNRSERKVLLSLLDKSKNLVADISLRKEVWKKLFIALRPGDYAFENVKAAYNSLYNNEVKSFNSSIEAKIKAADVSVLKDLSSRTGDFARRFHKLYSVFGNDAVNTMVSIAPEMDNIQLLKLQKYLSTINTRTKLIYPPKGHWNKAQLEDNNKVKIDDNHLNELNSSINKVLAERLNTSIPEGVMLCENTNKVKLQTNDQKLADYGRGTVFDLPEDVNFIRSASFWAIDDRTTFFDNGWNFFNSEWKGLSSCCWNSTHNTNGAAFSGDPINTQDLQGRACQMIDLYIDKLINSGVRYAVWNILSYHNLPFDDAKEVLATLQWGENAEEGKLYEPSRVQMSFPITGKNLTKYIAYVDLVERKLVYIDANLKGSTQSAANNIGNLEKAMPAFIEYMDSLPSIADLFANAKQGEMPVLYSDAEVDIKSEKAYVFRPRNADNSFERFDVNDIL